MLIKPLNLLSLAAGAMLPLAFAPMAWWPLAIVSGCLYMFIIDKQYAELDYQEADFIKELKSLVKSSLMYWLGFYLAGVSWVYVSIHVYGNTPMLPAAIMSLLFCFGLALVSSLQVGVYHLLKLHKLSLITFPASIVTIEWFRSWFLSGFPWLYNGYALLDSPFESLASLGGVYLLSFTVLVLASSTYQFLKVLFSPNKSFSFSVIFLVFIGPVLIISLTFFIKQKNWIEVSKEENLYVHLIQGNIPQEDKWLPENQKKILVIYSDLIEQSLLDIEEVKQTKPNSRHLIILPEAAMPTFQSELKEFFYTLDSKIKMKDAALISGIFYDEFNFEQNEFNVYNSITAVGNGNGLYHKQKLVPFGEYVPLEKQIRGLLPFFDLPFSSFSRGLPNQKDLQAFSFDIAPFICYEVLYPELVYRQGKNADFLLTISNDAWFGNSWGPEQHFQMARMRALELGKYLVRTTNTGTTAIIGPDGKVVTQLEKNKRLILKDEIFNTSGTTPFSHWGNSPILLLNFMILAICAVYSLTRSLYEIT